MNQTKKYNRIKYVTQKPVDGEGLFDIFKSTGKKIASLAVVDKTVDKLSAPSIVKENKPSPNSGTKILDSLKK